MYLNQRLREIFAQHFLRNEVKFEGLLVLHIHNMLIKLWSFSLNYSCLLIIIWVTVNVNSGDIDDKMATFRVWPLRDLVHQRLNTKHQRWKNSSLYHCLPESFAFLTWNTVPLVKCNSLSWDVGVGKDGDVDKPSLIFCCLACLSPFFSPFNYFCNWIQDQP